MQEHAVHGLLEAYSHGTLDTDQTNLLETHLSECEECLYRLAQTRLFIQHLADISRQQVRPELPVARGAERRRERRVETLDSGFFEVVREDPTDLGSVEIVDVSANGLGLRSRTSVAPGTLIQVHLSDTVIRGKVQFCAPRANAFHLGVKISQILAKLR